MLRRASCVLALLGLACVRPASADEPQPPFRLGFSYAMFTDVNENDARASIRGLAATIARERAIPADPDSLLLAGSDSVEAALRSAKVDAVALAADEYWLVTRTPGAVSERCLVAVQQEESTDSYVVIARKDRGLQKLADLHDKRLAVLEHHRLRLGFLWLEVMLARQNLPAASAHFKAVNATTKLSKVVLDVFFNRADAALVTQRGFEAMRELNPQIGQQLAAIETSPRYISALFAFRAGLATEQRDHLLDEFCRLNQTPAGQQALTIFQSSEVRQASVASLADSLSLIDEYVSARPDTARRFLNAVRHRPQEPWGKP